MAERAQSTNISEELFRAYQYLADELFLVLHGQTERPDHPVLVVQCCDRLLDALPPGPGSPERILALLARTAGLTMQGNAEDAQLSVSEALVELQAYAEALERAEQTEEAARREAE